MYCMELILGKMESSSVFVSGVCDHSLQYLPTSRCLVAGCNILMDGWMDYTARKECARHGRSMTLLVLLGAQTIVIAITITGDHS